VQAIRSAFRAVGVAIIIFAMSSAVADAASVTAVSTADYDTCGVLASGEVECWGSQLLGSTVNESSTPVLVPGISDAIAVTGSEDHRCALLSSGGVDCWGANNWGQLAKSTPSESSLPVVVSGISNAIAVSVGQYDVCVLLMGGTVDCWGNNSNGALGNGTENSSPTPTVVSGLSNAVAISATGVGSFTCALISNGTVECWGAGFGGQLGNGKTETALTPVTVSGISNAVAISAGWDHACAVLATGSIECWGEGEGFGPYSGVLGDGTTEGSSTPVLVSGLNTATSVSAGFEDTCATLSDGSAWCWGEGAPGGLGDGTLVGSLTPVRVSEPKATAPESGGPTEPTKGEETSTPGGNGSGTSTTSGNGTSTTSSGSAPKSNPSQKPISGAAAFSLPPANQCVSRRRFTIHVRTLPGITWVSAVIKINGKRVKSVGRSHITALVSLVGLPKGTFVLSITAKASNGQSVTGTRTYHTCVPKSKSHYVAPKL
jgi:Regulator of chromosome condensation (RCC1) repeat